MYIFILSLILVFVGSVSYYFTSQSVPIKIEDSTSVSQELSQNIPARQSINDLLKRGGNYACTFDEENSIAKTIAYVSIADKRLSGGISLFPKDLRVPPNNIVFIRNPDFTYIWQNNLTSAPQTAVKFRTLPVDAEVPSGAKGFIDFSRELPFKCISKVANEKLFIVPPIVTFINLY